VLDELFAQAGVIRTAGLDELTDAARMLVDQPLPTGARLGVVGNAGGLTRLAVTSAEAAGLRLDGGGPIDTGAAATPSTIAAAVETVAAGGAADLLLVMIVGTRTNVPHAIMTAVGDVLDRHPRLAAACVLTGSADDIHHIGARRVPVYRQPDRAVGALAHAQRYATWRRECPGRPVTPEGIHPGRAAAVLERAGNTVHGWVPRQTTAEVLAAYGIVVQPLSYAYTGVAAVAAAEHLGYPVIARTAGSKRVRLGLTCATAVRDAFDDLTAPGDPVREVLLQRQVTAPAELSAAVVTEPPFGPVLQLGRRDERAVSLVPLTDADAGRMWRTLGCAPVLTGDRGTPAVDTTALERLLLRLGRLAADQPRIGRLELAPIYAGPGGVVVADARLRVTTEPAEGRR
jgi:acyl-CoA synthetase (NDP forming)